MKGSDSIHQESDAGNGVGHLKAGGRTRSETPEIKAVLDRARPAGWCARANAED